MSFTDPTVQLLSPLIQKPPITTKYLERPPFRYIHDICTSLMSATGYGQGLWNPDQLKSDNVKEKEQKMDFLQRLITCTSLAVGHPIDVSPAKIVAGLEPEKTNILLQEMARAGANMRNLNMTDLIQRMSRGEKPGAAPQRPPQQQQPPPQQQQQQRPPQQQPPQQQPPQQQRPPQAIPPPQQQPPPSQMRGAVPSQGGRAPIALPPPVAGEDPIMMTQRTLGSLIDKPKMLTKLLQKPPVKFILDCVISVQQTTGFGDGYWSTGELDANNLTDPKAKLTFLSRLIKLVAVASGDSNVETVVMAKKIAAGLEPENTNLLLTRMAEAAASGISPSEVMNRMNGSTSNGIQQQQDEPQQPLMPKKQEEVKAPIPKLGLNELTSQQKMEDPDQDENTNPNASSTSQEPNDIAPKTNVMRPKTARRAPPKQKSHLVEESKNVEQGPSGGSGKIEMNDTGSKATSNVITENEKVEDEPEEEPEETFAEPLQGFEPTPSADQAGALVRKILDATKEKTEEKDKGGIKFGKIGATVNKSLFSQQQIDDLRAQIQKLCQSANPLGKCIDFVYEDMDQMNKELARWRKAYQGYTEKLEEEKRATEEMLLPLQKQLTDAEVAVQEQHKKIHAIKATILRNDQTIATLMEQKSTVQ